MATVKIDLEHGKWTKITDAGESGTFWLRQLFEGNILLDHSVSAGAASYDIGAAGEAVGLNTNKAYPIEKDKTILDISADSGLDIFYAAYIDGNPDTPETPEIVVDVIG